MKLKNINMTQAPSQTLPLKGAGLFSPPLGGWGACILFILLSFNTAFAIGTAAGVTINNYSTDVTINFEGPTGVTFNITTSPQLTNTVLGIKGFNFSTVVTTNLLNPVSNNIYTNAGVLGTVKEYVINLANQPSTISFQTTGTVRSISGNPGTLGNWNFSIPQSQQNLASETATDNFVLGVIPAANAANQSIVAISVNVTVLGSNPNMPNQQYTGFNQTVYGGYTFYQYQLNGMIFSPLLNIVTRSVQVIAPTANGYAGPSNAVIPGSKIIYTTVIRNDGSDDATNANISDYIPQNAANAEYLTGSAAGTGTPTITYLNPTNTITPENAVDPKVKKINWQYTSIPIGESRTINYTVVIK